ncbi:hypothetical protein [Nocardioides turkmenicus]|uniref:hypothetical protein n=1 Tax=Nocardioides turkmenicus TaxID=2711220 RepID=UPI001F49EF57|nr:hypothetical protein [Nocardioides sp. KC13]
MSTSVEAGRSGTLNTPAGGLPKLYFVRFGFAIVWAVLVALTASTLGPASIALLVIYPLFDVVAAVVDFRTSGASGPRVLLYVNMALSLLTAVGVAVAATSGIPDVLRVWGAWAINRRPGAAVRRGAALPARRPVGDDPQRWDLDVRGDGLHPDGRWPERIADRPRRVRQPGRHLLPHLCPPSAPARE